VLKPAGLENAKGIVSTAVIKHPDDPAWADDEGVKDYVACFRSCDERGACQYPDPAGDELTRENIRDLAQNIDVQPTMYIDGVKFITSPDDLDPIKTFQLIQFDGEKWVQLDAPITAE